MSRILEVSSTYLLISPKIKTGVMYGKSGDENQEMRISVGEMRT